MSNTLRFTDAETGAPIEISTDGLLGYVKSGSTDDFECLATFRYKDGKRLSYKITGEFLDDVIEQVQVNNADSDSLTCVHRYKAKRYRSEINRYIQSLESLIEFSKLELSHLVYALNALEGCYK